MSRARVDLPLERIDALRGEGLTSEQIAERLRAEGFPASRPTVARRVAERRDLAPAWAGELSEAEWTWIERAILGEVDAAIRELESKAFEIERNAKKCPACKRAVIEGGT